MTLVTYSARGSSSPALSTRHRRDERQARLCSAEKLSAAACAIARLGRLLQPGQPAIIQRCDVPLNLRQPAVQARLVRREGKFPVDATHRLIFSHDQAGQILGKVPAGGLGVEQITKNRQRFLHDAGKVHNSGHRGRLLSTTSTCGIMDGPSILRGATDFAKLQ